MTRISATQVMIEHNTKLARDPKHLRRLVAFWPEENIVHQLAKQALADLAIQKKITDSGAVITDMAASVIPAGWKLVPIEPTEDMVIHGFESAPDEFFSDADVWEEFEAMSGCQQAAHKAKLCWAAMLAVAPEAGK